MFKKVPRNLDGKVLHALLSVPTAPYREAQVKAFLERECTKAKVKWFEDPVGNIILGVSSRKEYEARLHAKSTEPVRVFIAHMDHPGFHGLKWLSEKTLAVKWFGGTPRKHLAGAKLWVSAGAEPRQGILKRAKLNKYGSAIESGVVEFGKVGFSKSQISPGRLYGGFGFRAPVWEEKGIVYTKAADDLIGAYTILSLAKKFRADKNFLGLLTRAEEVGFIGAIGHFELGWLARAKRQVVCVSLETSRTLPGAIIGKGPVVRLGDRAIPFSPDGTEIATRVARRKLKDRFQRRIMDGGTCEATAATVYGFKSIGISIPLGNYHNQCFEGGPDARGEWGPAPEFVHLDDISGMLTLCEGLLEKGLGWDKAWALKRKEFNQLWKNARRYLAIRD